MWKAGMCSMLQMERNVSGTGMLKLLINRELDELGEELQSLVLPQSALSMPPS